MNKIIPVIKESTLENFEWKCPDCHEPTAGANCKSCGLPRPEGMVIIPDGEEGEEIINRLTSPRRCGDCVHFDLKFGQEFVHDRKEGFIPRLDREMNLRSVRTQINWKEVGICRYWTGGRREEFFTCTTSPARVHKWRLDSSVPFNQKDENVECPAFEPRGSDGKVIESYRMTPGSRTRGTD
jgi:hypothetical protein